MEPYVPPDLVPDPLLVCRVDGAIEHANAHARRLFDLPGQASVSHLSDLGIDVVEGTRFLRRAARTTGLAPGRVATAVGHGEPRHWLAWGRRLAFDDPRVAVRLEDPDRSSFRHLSRQLDSLHAEVARRIDVERQLHELVTDTLARLQRANQSLSRYASSVAHDLRSPLVAIRGFADLLPDPASADDAEMVAGISRNANRALEMVDGLLDETAAPLPTDLVDVAAVADWAIDALEAAIRQSGAIVHVGELPKVRVPQATIRHVLYNLLRNAIQHHPRHQQPVVEIAAERGVGAWRVRVDDDGAGVPPDDRERVFERGVRLGSADSDGYGLGLPSCRAALRDFGADLHVEDGRLGGACFVVTLPGDGV